MALKTHRLAPLSAAAPDSVVIFLHGLGDSGSGGLLEIGRIWSRVLPTTEFICPDAPFAFDMAPPDFGGRQWFSLREFSKRAVDEGVKTAAPILNDYIDHILATRSIKPTQLALVGFSQGTMMALHVATRRAEPVAAVIGYSGKLVAPETLIAEKISAPPILLIHGTADETLPFTSMQDAEQALKAAHIPVQTLACPGLGHSIDDAGLNAGLDFLKKNGI